MRDTCGLNALCRPVLHRAQCACPDCYAGDPAVGCAPDPSSCVQRAGDGPVVASRCAADADCPPSRACSPVDGACRDPCDGLSCEPPRACVVRNHRARCACKYGFAVSELGELSCAPAERECRADADCAPHLRCTGQGRCLSPCDGGVAGGPCPADKRCLVLDHRAVCVCADNCAPTASMCLRDAGCPEHEACVNFACVDPCANVTCPADAPCGVDGHRAVCKFCPAGYSADSKSGCLKGKCTKKNTQQRHAVLPIYIHIKLSISSRVAVVGGGGSCVVRIIVPQTTVVVIRIFVDRPLVRCHSLLGPKFLTVLDQNIDKNRYTTTCILRSKSIFEQVNCIAPSIYTFCIIIVVRQSPSII